MRARPSFSNARRRSRDARARARDSIEVVSSSSSRALASSSSSPSSRSASKVLRTVARLNTRKIGNRGARDGARERRRRTRWN